MSQNYSNIVAASEDGCYKKLYEEYRDLYREAVQGGGSGDLTIEDVVEGKITEINTQADVVPVNPYLNLRTVNMPNCTALGLNAFMGCSLESISLPNVESVSSGAFTFVTASFLELPKLQYVSSNVFMDANITNMSFPNAVEIEDFAFAWNQV